jgi:hypothetical protein
MIYLLDIKKSEKNKEILKEFNKYNLVEGKSDKYSHKILYYEPSHAIYGGGELYQKTLNSLAGENGFLPQKQRIYVLKNIFFEVESDSINEDLDLFNWHCQKFYRCLYEQLTNFAVNNNLDALFVYINKEEYEDILFFGKWIVDAKIEFSNEMLLCRLPMSPATRLKFSELWEPNDHCADFIKTNGPIVSQLKI